MGCLTENDFLCDTTGQQGVYSSVEQDFKIHNNV